MKRVVLSLLCLFVLVAVVKGEDRTIRFAGLTWNVRDGRGGPGPNQWSASTQSVWIDDQGQLHLKIRHVDGVWQCAEIWTQESLGYGEYVFQLASNVEIYDRNVVAGLFTYLDDTHEIDIEFSRWGVVSDPAAQYVIQPGSRPGNLHRFNLGLTGDYSTHSFNWREGSVFFQSFHGHGEGGHPPARSQLIQEWLCKSRDIPKAGGEKLHINLWMYNGKAPTDSKEVELIIEGMKVKRMKDEG